MAYQKPTPSSHVFGVMDLQEHSIVDPLVVCPSLRDGPYGHGNHPPHPGHDPLAARHANLIRSGPHRARCTRDAWATRSGANSHTVGAPIRHGCVHVLPSGRISRFCCHTSSACTAFALLGTYNDIRLSRNTLVFAKVHSSESRRDRGSMPVVS